MSSSSRVESVSSSSSEEEIIEQQGELAGRKVIQWQEPLFVVLIILGVGGLGAAGTGLAAFGTQQSWWVAGLSNLTQIDAIAMMAGGGGGGLLLIVLGSIGLNKTPNAQSTTEEIDLVRISAQLLDPDTPDSKASWFTFTRQKDGLYSLVTKTWDEQKQIFTMQKAEVDLAFDCLPSRHNAYLAREGHGNFKKTDPYEPHDLLISEAELFEQIGNVDNFSFVQQVNGDYALVVRIKETTTTFHGNGMQQESVVEYTVIAQSNIPPTAYALACAYEPYNAKGYRFVTTSQLPESLSQLNFSEAGKVNLDEVGRQMDSELARFSLDILTTPNQYTFVRQSNGLYSVVVRLVIDGQYKPDIVAQNKLYSDLNNGRWDKWGGREMKFVRTSPYEPQAALIDPFSLFIQLPRNSFTFVLQVNGKYAKYEREQTEAGAIPKQTVVKDIEPTLETLEQATPGNLKFVLTSPLPIK